MTDPGVLFHSSERLSFFQITPIDMLIHLRVVADSPDANATLHAAGEAVSVLGDVFGETHSSSGCSSLFMEKLCLSEPHTHKGVLA